MVSSDNFFCAFVFLTFTMEFKVVFPVMAAKAYDVSSLKRSSEETFIIPHGDKERIRHVATIIDALEKLNILDSSKQFCYSLNKIVKTMVIDKHTNSWKIGMSLHVKEVGRKRLKGIEGAVTSHPDGDVEMTSSGSNDEAGTADLQEKCILSDKSSGIVEKPRNDMSIITDNASEQNDMEVKMSNGSGNVSSVAMVGEKAGKHAGNKKNSPAVTEINTTEEPDGRTRLSKTQVMVISTCSAVVGVFFIIAVILRINNYIKRKREEQAAARRPSYRSTSFGLQANSQSQQNDQNDAKDGRLEAALNKGSSETAAMVSGHKDEEDDGDITPKLSNQETRPLLIVTAASAPSSPCLQRTRGDYQYSNKDDDETMTADENHDKKPSSKQTGKNKDVSNRRRPKQRRSNNGYTRVDGPNSDSLREEDEDDDQDSNDESSGTYVSDTNTFQTSNSGISKDMNNRLPNGVPLSGPVPKNEIGDVNSVDGQPAMISWVENETPHQVDNLQGHAPDLENGDPEELEEVVSQDPEAYLTSIPEHYDVEGVGFTQSDSSISSINNPSYRYGNQVEYTGVQQYPNIEYCPEFSGETVEEFEQQRHIKRIGDLPKVPFKTFESFDQYPTSVERQVSVDSLTYNESPPMRRQLSSSFQASSFEDQQDKEKQADFWLEEGGDEDVSSPVVDSARFAFPNERFSFREERLPNIQEDEACELGNLQKRGIRERKFRNSGKTVLTRQKNTIQEDAETPLAGEQGDMDSQRLPSGERPLLENGEMENESSDSDSGDVASSTLLPDTQTRSRKKRHRKSNQATSWSILEDPDFEGMEPTYV